jgi:hypothetical protein
MKCNKHQLQALISFKSNIKAVASGHMMSPPSHPLSHTPNKKKLEIRCGGTILGAWS